MASKPIPDTPTADGREAHDGTLIVGAGGAVVASDEGARGLLGYSEAELTRFAFEDLIVASGGAAHPGAITPWKTRGGSPSQFTARVRRSSGVDLICEIAIAPVSFSDVDGFVASLRRSARESAPASRWSDSDQRWRTLLEQLGDTLFFWDFRRDHLEFTRGWLISMGYEPREIATGKQWFELVHPHDRERVRAAADECIDGVREHFECEFRLQQKTGEYRWLFSTAHIIDWSEDGDSPLMVGFYRDTTEKRRAQDELATEQSRWEHALRGSGLGVWDWNLLSGDVYFSAEWKRMIGYEPGDLEPTIDTWRRLADPVDLAASDAAIAAHLAGETEEYRAECRISTKSGETKWVLDRGQVVERADDGTPVRMVGTHDDITKMRKREIELRESRERLHGIASLVPGMLYQFELKPDGRMRFPYASERMFEFYGVTPAAAAVDAEIVFQRLHPDDVEQIRHSIKASAANFEPWESDFRVVEPGGSYRWLRGVANPKYAPAGDGTLLWDGYFSDVTERKRANIELQQHVRALHVANEDLEQFNSIAAHDLKEPLRSIRHLSEWIAADLPEDVPESVRTNFARLTARTERLGELIDGLAEYSRAGRRDARLTLVDPVVIARELGREIDLGPCAFEVRGPEGDSFMTSDIALETVLRNLIVNAVVHHDAPADGHIRVTVEPAAASVLITVEDDGPGIAPEHHERVFRMYQRLDPGAGKPGSGSGLAIVRRIVNHVGSRIEIESPIDHDRGTRFRFVWPRAWPQDQAGG